MFERTEQWKNGATEERSNGRTEEWKNLSRRSCYRLALETGYEDAKPDGGLEERSNGDAIGPAGETGW